ncbi:MAG: FAD-dependent oxidoreductase [Leptolyngbya sp.]|nr:FAD-dependent oxidoreductase [Leptolyngbya sp.]
MVIIGGTPAGAIAAQTAARLGARVAWLWQGTDLGHAHLQFQGWLWGTQRLVTAEATAAILGIPSPALPETAWQAVQQWAALIADLPRLPMTTALTVAGVDILQGTGQVVGDRPLRVQVQDRTLSTRRLVLALATVPPVPNIPGAETIPWLTPATLLTGAHPPASVVVMGQQPEALALAQALATWGSRVHLVSTAPTLLPQEDPAVAQWLQAQLTAVGVQLHLGMGVERLTVSPTGVLVSGSAGQIETAATLLGTPPRPQIPGLNLARVGLGEAPPGLAVNSYLQSVIHPDIYACGGSLGGYDLPTLSAQEAAIAVENALFWHRRRVDYSRLPYSLLTQPPLGRVGLTEPQARRRYGEAIRIYTSHWDHQPVVHWRGEPTGFCKLIVQGDTLVGAHGVGPEAPSLVASVAPLVGRRRGMVTLAQGAVPRHSPLVGLQAAAQQWQGDRWQPGQWRRDWAENWCHWRRSQRG